MSLDVACPHCQTRLKAPEGMAGKKARCKKCQQSFRIPGPDDASDGDAGQLSVVGDSPFSFNGDAPAPEPAKPAAKKKSAPPPPAGSNPFAVPDAVAAEPTADPPSKSKYRTKTAAPEKKASAYRGKPAAARGKSRLPLFALAGLLCAGGGAAAFFAYSELQKKDKPAPTAAAPVAPPNDPPAPAPEPAKAKDDKGKRANAAAAPADKAADERKAAGPRVQKARGGLKLPPPNPSPMPFEKAAATVPLDHPPAAVKQLMVGGGDGAFLLVTRRTFDGLSGKGAKDTIDRYSLATGRRTDQTEVPADGVKTYPRVCDVSPTGDKFAYEHPAGKLTVTLLGAKSNVVEGLDLNPPDGDNKAMAAPVGVAGLFFLTEDAVAVVTKAGVVEVWDVAAKKRVSATEPLPPGTNLVNGRTFTFRADSDPKKALEASALFAFAGGAIYQVPVGGKPKAVFPLPRKPTDCLAVAVESGGERVAVAYKASDPGEHVRVAHGRLGDPEPKGDLALDPEVGPPTAASWNRPETFTVRTDGGHGFACDADTGDVIAAFRPEKPSPHVAVEGVKHWFLLPDAADAKKAVVVNVTLPPEGYSPSLTGAKWQTLSLTVTPQGTAK